jgi:hypothetical protein
MTKTGTRGAGFAPRDVKLLLDLVEEHLPMGNQDWEFLAVQYNESKFV